MKEELSIVEKQRDLLWWTC